MVSVHRYAAAVAISLLLVGIAQAETVTLDAASMGFYSQSTDNAGYHDPDNWTYLVGRYADSEYRNFFVFDLSHVTGTVTSAQLTLNTYDILGGNDVAHALTYNLYDVTTPIVTLTANATDAGATFGDLGSGTLYGSRGIVDSDANLQVAMLLNGDALHDLNIAIGGSFAIGGALATADMLDDQYVFAFSGDALSDSRLTLETVPEPGAFALLLTGAAALFALTFRRR